MKDHLCEKVTATEVALGCLPGIDIGLLLPRPIDSSIRGMESIEACLYTYPISVGNPLQARERTISAPRFRAVPSRLYPSVRPSRVIHVARTHAD